MPAAHNPCCDARAPSSRKGHAGGLLGGRGWLRDEDRVAEGMLQVECPRTPRFIVRRTTERDTEAPRAEVLIGIRDFLRNARIAPVPRHRAVKRDRDCPASDT